MGGRIEEPAKSRRSTIGKSKVDVMFIVTAIMMDVMKKPPDPNDKTLWPRDFFEALTMPDWRDWIMAVKKEISSYASIQCIYGD